MKHIGLLIGSVIAIVANAQSNKPISLQLYLSNNGIAYTGNYSLTVKWYTQAVGGLPIFEEQFSVFIEDGITSVLLGSNKLLPTSILLNDAIFLGITVNGLEEITPRTLLVAAPYARVADVALTAQALEPGASGLVSSINEIAGAVRIHGDSSIVVRRNGNALHLHSNVPISERGIIIGNNSDFEYIVQPQSVLTENSSISITLPVNSTISAHVVGVLPNRNQFILRTSAILQSNEQVIWTLLTP